MRIFLAAIACLLATSAGASTLTFDHVDQGQSRPEVATSDGFIYEYTTLYLSGNHLYLHDDGGILESDIRREDGQRFTPHSVDVWGISFINKSGSGPAPTDQSSFLDWATSGIASLPTLTFQGIRDGQVVAIQSAGPQSFGLLSFTGAFSHLDALRVLLNIPTSLTYAYDWQGTEPNTQWCYEWCASFRVDNMEYSIAPVPVPPALPMFLAGLGMLGFMSRRFRT